MRSKLLKWLPAAVVPIVIAGGTLTASASSDVDIPAKTPEQVLALAKSADVHHFVGKFKRQSDLGLPSLPENGPGSDANLSSALALASGTHHGRVYVADRHKSRVQLMDKLAERDIVRNGRTVWTYDSSKNKAVKTTLPARRTASKHHATTSPNQEAKKFLAKVSPNTRVELGNDTTVAGRSVYDLKLTPRTSKTLIGSVDLAIDAKTGATLSLAVTARGANDPAFKTAFQSISYKAPKAGRFEFTPPQGATVKQKTIERHHHVKQDDAKPQVVGSDWTSIVVIPAEAAPADHGPEKSKSLQTLTKSVAKGRLLSTSLVNVLFTDDGRILAGSVPASALQAAAQQ